MRASSASRFLNVDLDLRAAHDLMPLAAALEGRIFVFPREPDAGGQAISFEVIEADWRSPTRSVQGILATFCDLVEGLPPEARAVWETCTRRDFNVGFDSAAAGGGQLFEGPISADTLARIARLGATLSFTVYPGPTVASGERGAYARTGRRRHRGRIHDR